MTVSTWLEDALADATARGLPDLRPLLEMLARATRQLRDADWNEDPAESPVSSSHDAR